MRKPISLDKSRGGVEKILAICECGSIKVQFGNCTIGWRDTIMKFNSLKKEHCPKCS